MYEVLAQSMEEMTEEGRYYCCRMLSKNRGRSSRYSDIAKIMEQKKYLLRETEYEGVGNMDRFINHTGRKNRREDKEKKAKTTQKISNDGL